MTATDPVTPSESGFLPLAPMLLAIAPAKLASVRERVAGLDRDALINRFRRSFAAGQRVAALTIADELTKRGTPPAFWHGHLSAPECGINQKFDATVYDFRWLRRAHSDHVKQVRYARYRELFTFNETNFHRAAEYVFYQGKRPAWKIVASLSLGESQQFDLYRLRSAPIAKRCAATKSMRRMVFEVLQDEMRTVRRTKTFTSDDADASLLRRHDLWVCAQMTNGSAAETAVRYFQLTGREITRDVAKRQLQIVDEILSRNGVTTRCKT